jgi:hypothetical protein
VIGKNTAVVRPILWAGGVVIVSALVVLAFLLRSTAPVEPEAPKAEPFPAPPKGATVFARPLGADALALGVVPQGRRLLVQASVLGPQGSGVSGLDIAFSARNATRAGVACGPGCYRATLPVGPTIAVAMRGTTWRVALPATWPARDATGLVAAADRAWRALRSLSFTETLASSPAHRTVSTWRMQAPDRLAYTVRDGWSGIIVGAHRWDRPPKGKKWLRSPQMPVTQPVPGWSRVTDAHVLGTGTVGGRPVWRVSFFDPASHAWFAIAIDRATLRTLDLHMVTTAHFMHDVYGSFNSAEPVRAP